MTEKYDENKHIPEDRSFDIRNVENPVSHGRVV
jgi:hypothetical protein